VLDCFYFIFFSKTRAIVVGGLLDVVLAAYVVWW